MTKTKPFIAVIAVALLASACAVAVPKTYAQDALIVVEAAPGKPMAGVPVTVGGAVVSRTTKAGEARITVEGREGDVFHVALACPEGSQPASSLELDVIVRRVERKENVPRFAARCAPLLHPVNVSLRSANGVGLPVLYLGREVARTDAAGLASLTLDVHPGEDVELTLDTRGNKKLHPQNPSLTFRADEREGTVALEQPFSVDKPKPVLVAVVRSHVARSLSTP